jgi:hypothetical protein
MEKVEQYVYDNYKSYKDIPLIIEEYDTHYTVKAHKDGSCLVLSKSIV